MNDQELRAIYDIVYAHECTFKAFATDIRALLADGGKGEAVAYVFPVTGSGATDLQGNPGVTIDAPQAERAPREAQPIYQVRPRNGEEWTDVGEAEYKICGGAGYVQRVVYAAPTPERADAAPKLSAKQDFESVWEKARAMDETTKTMARFIWDSAQSAERADAEKDAALTDERAKEIAQQVHAECSRIPGATFYNAAMSAIEQAVKERK
jgi:hypothetical protein